MRFVALRAAGLGLALLSCIAVVTPARAQSRRAVTITTLPFDDTKQQEAVFSFLSDRLSQAIGAPVRFQASTSYDEVIERLSAGTTDVAFLGAVSYLEARRRGQVRAILRSIRHGSSQYRGIIIVPRGSPITKVEQLAGKRFAFVDRRSTAGYLLPRVTLAKAGITESKLQVSFAGNHAAVVDQVVNGNVDAGACFEEAPINLADPAAVRIIAYTEPTPGDPVVVRPGLGPELVRKLRSALVELATIPAAKPFFEFAEIDAFVPATDADYDGIAKLSKEQLAP